jgi:hypothetical protein
VTDWRWAWAWWEPTAGPAPDKEAPAAEPEQGMAAPPAPRWLPAGEDRRRQVPARTRAAASLQRTLGNRQVAATRGRLATAELRLDAVRPGWEPPAASMTGPFLARGIRLDADELRALRAGPQEAAECLRRRLLEAPELDEAVRTRLATWLAELASDDLAAGQVGPVAAPLLAEIMAAARRPGPWRDLLRAAYWPAPVPAVLDAAGAAGVTLTLHVGAP